eukprot:1781642-Amphidinium_carterae.2
MIGLRLVSYPLLACLVCEVSRRRLTLPKAKLGVQVCIAGVVRFARLLEASGNGNTDTQPSA